MFICYLYRNKNEHLQEMESNNIICHIDTDLEIDDIVLENINTNTI